MSANKILINGLLARASLRYLSRHPWQAGLSILGIALGIAVVIAVDIANASAERAFELSVEQIAGRATHQIESATGRIPDALYAQLLGELDLQDASPVVEATVRLQDQTFILLGLDLLSYATLRGVGADTQLAGSSLSRLLSVPGTLILGETDAQRLGTRPGGTLTLHIGARSQAVEVAGVLTGEAAQGIAGIAIADIATAQELTEQSGAIDRIDLVLAPGDASDLAQRLPDGLRLVESSQRSESLRQMTRAFSINLSAMSLLAMLVGGFIIYNTMTFAVLQRRQLLGALRTLGCTRAQLFVLVTSEALAFAAIGAVLGVALGILTGWGLVQLVIRTINDLYFELTVGALFIGPLTLIKGVGIGFLVTLIGALGPALEAARSQPREVLRENSLERRGQGWVGWLAALGLALVAIGSLAVLIPTRSLPFGFLALMLVILGYSLCVPALLRGLTLAISPLLGLTIGLPGLLAARGIASSITRTGIAAAALTIAIATTVGVGVMIDSFRGSLVVWLETTLSSDIYVAAASENGNQEDHQLPDGMLETLRGIDGIAGIATGRGASITTRAGPVRLLALGGASSDGGRGFDLAPGHRTDVWERFERGEVLLASEPFVYHRGLAVGERVSVFTGQGWLDIEIGGIFRDYGSDSGMLVMSQRRYAELWSDETLSSLGLMLRADVDGQVVLEAVRQVTESHDAPLLVSFNEDIRERSLTIFDRTFAITHILRLLAIGVAFVGILSALMALELERRREHAIMRASGMTRGQLILLILVQTSILGIVAGLFAIPLGLIMGDLLIEVINLRSFGWSMEMHIAPWPLISGVLLAWLAAFLAGIYPAFQSANAQPAAALRAE